MSGGRKTGSAMSGGVIKSGYDPNAKAPGNWSNEYSVKYETNGLVGKREFVLDRNGRIQVNEELLTEEVGSCTHNMAPETEAERGLRQSMDAWSSL